MVERIVEDNVEDQLQIFEIQCKISQITINEIYNKIDGLIRYKKYNAWTQNPPGATPVRVHVSPPAPQ